MDSEILFRAKRKDNGEWVEGFYIPIGKRAYIICEAETECVDGENTDLYATEWYEVDPETVCQYTGLTDKNGRKIFERDIVRDIFNASVVGIVRYGEYRNTFNDDEHGGHVGFYVEWKEKQDLLRKDLIYWVKNSEFIGNIYDNPELLGTGSASGQQGNQ